MSESEQHIMRLTTLMQLEKRARHAETLLELSFIMVNETLRLAHYHQAILWEKGPRGRIRIQAVSGVERPDANAPFIIYLRRVFKHLLCHSDKQNIHVLNENDRDEAYQEGWQEWALGSAIWCPLATPRGDMWGGLVFTRQTTQWDKGEIALIEQLADAYAHAWYALKKRQGFGKNLISPSFSGMRKHAMRLLLLVMFILLMGLPVRLSVLAPVEIVPFGARMVSSPDNGVVQQFYVEPNQEIRTGQLLFRLDDTRIRNEYEVSQKALEVVQAEYRRATQKAFMDEKSRANMLLLRAQIKQKSAQADYMAAMLKRSEVRAVQSGIAVFTDVNDWLGKPVVTGEKVLTIADPNQVEAEIQLPVADAINLKAGADILIFLNVEPDTPLPAKLRQASYEAQVTPDGILAFQIKAALTRKENLPRIGLRGTAKIYGKDVSLFFFLMRRPLSALRQILGA